MKVLLSALLLVLVDAAAVAAPVGFQHKNVVSQNMGGAVVNAVPRGQDVPPPVAPPSGQAIVRGAVVRDLKLEQIKRAQESAKAHRR